LTHLCDITAVVPTNN